MESSRGRLLALGIVVLLMATLLPVGMATATSDTQIQITASSGYGTIRGVDFTRHDCRFAGTADALTYTRGDSSTGDVEFDVSCSIILPDDPGRWNGRILVEPSDTVATGLPLSLGEFNRSDLLTDEFLFGDGGPQRWGYASLSYFGGVPGDFIDQPTVIGPFGPELPAAGLEIMADFAAALRSGGGSGLLGSGSPHGMVDAVAATGFSNQAAALRGVMALWPTFGTPIFDAALVMAQTGHQEIDPTGTFASRLGSGPLDFGPQRVLFVNSETEVIPNGTFDPFGFVPVSSSIPLRVEADGVHRFVYEVAGAAHLDPINQADLVALGVVPQGAFDESNPLVWTPVIRAVFAHLDNWLANDAAPPPSRLLDPAPVPTDPDDAYPGHPSVLLATVGRDASLNALGGIRLPDVELGVGRYLGVGPPLDLFDPTPTSFFQWLAGGFVDLSCEPMPDGSPRFANHGDYVHRFVDATRRLVGHGFLLRSDARTMIAAAAQSDIGRCG